MYIMIYCSHKKHHINGDASGSKPRASFNLCSGSSGNLYQDKDSSFIADTGESASGMDNRSMRSDASDLEYMDAQSK